MRIQPNLRICSRETNRSQIRSICDRASLRHRPTWQNTGTVKSCMCRQLEDTPSAPSAVLTIVRIRLIRHEGWQIFRCSNSLRMNRPEEVTVWRNVGDLTKRHSHRMAIANHQWRSPPATIQTRFAYGLIATGAAIEQTGTPFLFADSAASRYLLIVRVPKAVLPLLG